MSNKRGFLRQTRDGRWYDPAPAQGGYLPRVHVPTGEALALGSMALHGNLSPADSLEESLRRSEAARVLSSKAMMYHGNGPEFDIESATDDAGVLTYKARLSADYHTDGIPVPASLVGVGETVWEAVADLCTKLDRAST